MVMTPGRDYPKDWVRGECFTRQEVARVFRVDPATVTRWAKEGVIGFFRKPGGTRVFPEAEIERLLAGHPAPDFVRKNADIDNEEYKEKWKQGWHRPDGHAFGQPFYVPGVDSDPDAEGGDE